MKLYKLKHLNKANDKILTETNYWLMRIKAGDMTIASEIKFHKWLAADPKHQAKFDQMNAIWDGADIYLKDSQALGDLNEVLTGKYVSQKQGWFSGFSIKFPIPRLAVTAATVFFMLGGLWSVHYYRELSSLYHTDTGIQKIVTLSDGSSVFLDSETFLSFQFSGNSRRIELQKGRALFDVAHDPDHPFIVYTDNISVRTLGTKFSVDKAIENRVAVSVTEGSVLVEKKGAQQSDSVDQVLNASGDKTITDRKFGPMENKGNLSLSGAVLDSGQGMIIDGKSKAFEIRPLDEQRTNSWIEGRLYFYMTPLSDVIDEVNRYLDLKVMIGDPSLNEAPISLNFDIKQRDLFLPTLVSAMAITVKKTDNGHYILYQK